MDHAVVGCNREDLLEAFGCWAGEHLRQEDARFAALPWLKELATAATAYNPQLSSQLLLQKLIDLRRIRLATRLLHHLPDEETEQLLLP